MTNGHNGKNDGLPPTANYMVQRPKPSVRAKTFFLYSPAIITPHCGHAALGGNQEYPNTRVSSRKRMIQAPKSTTYLNPIPFLVCVITSTHLVRSFSFSTIRTLLGTLRRISNTEISKPSRFMTASLIASISSVVWGSMSIIPEARLNVASEESSSPHVPSNAARPVIAASNTGY